MEEIISWLLTVEKMAGQLYADAKYLFTDDPELVAFLEHLANDEALHALAMGSAATHLRSTAAPPPDVFLLDDSLRKRVEGPFQANLEKLRAGTLDRQTLLTCIAVTEFSEWNDIFLYVINLLKSSSREFQWVAARMHNHQSHIRRFLAGEPALAEELARIDRLPRVWKERILVVDDSEAIRDLLEAILEDLARIEKAADPGEGMRKIEKSYFDLVISDVNMPQSSGMQFYEQAVAQNPELRNRFLFYTGYPAEETLDFFKRHGLRYLLKPATIDDLKETVGSLLQQQTLGLAADLQERA